MRHTLPYLVFCGVTIALLVFLNSTQPFVLSDIFGLNQKGTASGVLALVDEIVSVIMAPLWGALSDKVGTRYVAVASVWIMTLGLFLYPRAPNFAPFLLIIRGFFAIGASGAVAMITAALAELSMIFMPVDGNNSRSASISPVATESRYNNSGVYAGDAFGSVRSSGSRMFGEMSTPFGGGTYSSADALLGEDSTEFPIGGPTDGDGDETVPLFEAPDIDNEVFSSVAATLRPNGRLAGMAGFAAGLGAVFAVSVLLPLPTRFDRGTSEAEGLTRAFTWVSAGAFGVSLMLLLTLYQNPVRGLRSFVLGSENVSIFDEAALDAGGSVMSYMELLQDGFLNARHDRRLGIAYLGSMVARSASVVLALFIPLWVNQWYTDEGLCSVGNSLGGGVQAASTGGCHDAIVRAAILTGVANTVVLLAAPFVGLAGDRYGAVWVLGTSSVLGVAAMAMFIFADSPLGILPVLAACLFGVAQIGCSTMSMSMSTDQRRVSPGSVAGVYSLAGSIGILLITQIGGPLADLWLKFPFYIMALIFAALAVACHQLGQHTVLRTMRSSVAL